METHTKNIALIALAVALVAIVFSWIQGARDISLVQDAEGQRSVVVSGEAERFVAPDTARVSFAMTSKNANLDTATNSVNERINNLISSMGQYDIDEEDVKTTGYNVYPEYNYLRDSGERVFDGYRVTQTVELRIENLEKTADVMSAVARFEVDNVSGLSFFVEEDEEIRDELRSEAIADAKDKAKKLARELGVELDTLVGFHEVDNGSYYPMAERMMSMDMAEDSMGGGAVIPTGENKYETTVNLTFLIED